MPGAERSADPAHGTDDPSGGAGASSTNSGGRGASDAATPSNRAAQSGDTEAGGPPRAGGRRRSARAGTPAASNGTAGADPAGATPASNNSTAGANPASNPASSNSTAGANPAGANPAGPTAAGATPTGPNPAGSAPIAGTGGPVPQPAPPPLPAGGPARPRIGDSRPAPPPPPIDPRLAPAARGSDNDTDAAKNSGGSLEAAAGSRRRHRGRGKGGATRAATAAAFPQKTPTADEANTSRQRTRERKGRPVGRYTMVVHVQPTATQIAILEGRFLIEHYVSRPADNATQIDGNIYLGRVQNVLPGMEAAFVDIGTPKNAVLYRGDVRYDREDVEAPSDGDSKPTRGRLPGPARNARIEQLLKPGQMVLCQVTKNPIGAKGARLAQEVSLPGRFVVLIPGSDTYGISKRLPDEERKRLRRVLDEVRPEGHGLIVRTAAEGATADELRRDVARLSQQWERIAERARTARGPRLLYQEPSIAVRVIREEFNRDYRAVIIDDREMYEEVKEYVESITPELADRVEWSGDSDDPLPAFERYHVHEQIHKALDRKVWLPSGGSLIIERTEALTVIDVNTGKNVGTSNLEETVFRNNLEAAEEIARQLRLRDIGGIIVIDFIDMEIVANRGEVIRTFREALARDKTRTQVFDISELGLVEMTRKRVSEGLVESFSLPCPTCSGRGFVLDESLL
ncbi:MAG TPA: Rne/Rng family ribonuclease [Acidimicrobiales bacterium]|nr:Rne/Rng family ribonuclease [Acidimicrobiales bacterium]